MTTQTTMTPAKYAATFPRARGADNALRYVVVDHHPDAWQRAADAAEAEARLADGEELVQVGYTNKSRTKKITRYAVVAA